MCDLLGLSFNVPITAKISLDIFQQRGQANPDGWGLAFYQNDRLQIIKEAHSATNSSLYDFMERYTHSKTIISHVRRSTRGTPSYLNTHPFYRRLKIGPKDREFAFAHNGTLTQLEKLQFEMYKPLGETDSEQAFCHILDILSKRETTTWTDSDFEIIENTLREINDGKNTLNCIFSDGSYLFCYSDENDHNNGLRFTKQFAPFGNVELVTHEDRLGSVELRSEIPSALDQSGYLISTRILTSGEWTEFSEGELIVFKDGHIVYPKSRF
ncbi:MAG: class II glutamine amidotransferase [Candidatus Thorarchaeota archaeon]